MYYKMLHFSFFQDVSLNYLTSTSAPFSSLASLCFLPIILLRLPFDRGTPKRSDEWTGPPTTGKSKNKNSQADDFGQDAKPNNATSFNPAALWSTGRITTSLVSVSILGGKLAAFKVERRRWQRLCCPLRNIFWCSRSWGRGCRRSACSSWCWEPLICPLRYTPENECVPHVPKDVLNQCAGRRHTIVTQGSPSPCNHKLDQGH